MVGNLLIFYVNKKKRPLNRKTLDEIIDILNTSDALAFEIMNRFCKTIPHKELIDDLTEDLEIFMNDPLGISFEDDDDEEDEMLFSEKEFEDFFDYGQDYMTNFIYFTTSKKTFRAFSESAKDIDTSNCEEYHIHTFSINFMTMIKIIEKIMLPVPQEKKDSLENLNKVIQIKNRARKRKLLETMLNQKDIQN